MRRDFRRTALLAGAALAFVTPLAGCAAPPQPPGHVVLQVDHAEALTDQPVQLRVTGLRPHESVTVSAAAKGKETTWRSQASFRADGDGVVDLTKGTPRSGTYQKADGMGLFWSMHARHTAKHPAFVLSPPADQPAYTVRLTVADGDATLATRTVTRVRMADGVRHRWLNVDGDGVAGDLYLPKKGVPAAAPVLVLGGSEGGDWAVRSDAALFASHGHPALALCYFGCEGRPKHLQDISVEYLAKGARLLAGQDSAKRDKLVVIGYSRGAEAAQLLGQYHPELVEDVVCFSGSNVVNAALPDASKYAWTRHGKPVPEKAIPLDHVRGKVLDTVGGEDRLFSAEYLAQGVKKVGRLVVYPHAGHFAAGHPYLPEPRTKPMPGRHRVGGSRAANAASAVDAWPKVLELIDG
jgi:dienelactone hydrolase